MLLRPAVPVRNEDSLQLTASYLKPGTPLDLARREARDFADAGNVTTCLSCLKYTSVALEIAQKLRAAPVALSHVTQLVKQATGQAPGPLASSAVFQAEQVQLADTLVTMKLLSDSLGGDAPGVALAIQGYDAIHLAAGGRDPVILRVLLMPEIPASSTNGKVAANGFTNGWRGFPQAASTAGAARPAGLAGDLQYVVQVLDSLPASGFDASPKSLPATISAVSAADARVASGNGTRSWMLSEQSISVLPESVAATLAALGLDLRRQPLPLVMAALHARRVQQEQLENQAALPAAMKVTTFGNASSTIDPSDYVGDPAQGLPTGHGSLHPVGIGDLLLVKEHVVRYEGGDLAHVENILKTESLSRETRRLERTETTILQETETTKEETQDTQTTDRFSLQRETSDTLQTDSSLKTGVSVDAQYGAFVEVKANADYSTSTSDQSSTKQATDFSKDVVQRSTSKVVERVLERRSVTTITEFEEKYRHAFDNTKGSGHVSGFYQWIDKVLQAQVYSYGKRLLFDVTLPEPGTNFILSQTYVDQVSQPLEKPPAFTATPAEMFEGTYLGWAKLYDASGLEPPPEPITTVSKVLDAVVSQAPHESSKSDTIAIPEGYRAKYAQFAYDIRYFTNARWGVLIGSNWMEVVSGARSYLDMSGEVGSAAFAYETGEVEALAATIEIFCERTDRAIEDWQQKVHAAIMQAYQAKLQAYEDALAEARTAVGTVIAGRNPDFNQRLVSNELRRQCLTLVTGQQFDAFGALELSAEGYAQPDLVRTAAQMPYVRFFEQAFEWEHLIYFFYPYFWGWKPGWKNRMLLDDTDPPFGDFLRAGAARVVFPVRPGFEAAVVHYLETGEIWNGGPPPDISGSLYLPIVKEVQDATGAPGNEKPVGDPWEVRLPTTLVHIRPNDDLPKWHKVGETWQPTNG
jgi:hypothetical protein